METVEAVYYKVLAPNGKPFHGGTGTWPLPTEAGPGEWLEVEGKIQPCENGLHVCRPDDLIHWLGPEIYTVEVDPAELVIDDDKVVVRRARLLAKTPWCRAIWATFAADVAERVLPIFEERFPGEDRPRKAIAAARAASAAYAAADAASAAYAAAYAAYAAARAAYAAAAAARAASAAYAAARAAYAAADAAADAASAARAAYAAYAAARAADAAYAAYAAYAAADAADAAYAAADAAAAERDWQKKRLALFLIGPERSEGPTFAPRRHPELGASDRRSCGHSGDNSCKTADSVSEREADLPLARLLDDGEGR